MSEVSDEPLAPFPIEDFLASITEGLKMRGDARAVTAIVEGEGRLVFSGVDFGIGYWILYVALPAHIFYALSDDERHATECAIEEVGRLFFTSTPADGLKSVVIMPKVGPATETWREEAIRFVKGEGVTKQGRVRSDNIASGDGRIGKRGGT